MPFRKISFFNTTRTTVISAFLAIAIAMLSLLGWIIDREILRTFNPGWGSIKVNTALGIILSAVSLLLFASGKKKRLAFLLAFVVLLLGAVSLCQYLFHWNAHIDELFFGDKKTPAGNYPGRMAKLSAISFIVFGISLLCYPSDKKYLQRVSEFSAVLVLISSFTAFIAYFYSASQLFKAVQLTFVSIPVIFCGILLSVSILFSRPDKVFLAAFYKQTNAARVGIKGIFIIVTILVLFGWLCLKGVEAGLYNKELGLAIMILTFTFSFIFVTWSATRSLNEAEEELQKSEEQYRTLIEQASDYIMITDQEGNFVDVNSSLCKTFGYGRKELLGMNVSAIIDPVQLKNDPIRFDLLIKGQSILRERRMMNKDGTIIEVEANVKMIPDGRILAIARNITERKKAEEELKQSNNRFEMITRTTNDAIWEWDLETGKLWGNETHQHLYGLTVSDPVPVEETWRQRIHPDDRELIVNRQAEALASDKNVFISGYRFLTEKNGYRDIYDRCYIVKNEKGKAVRMVGSMMDITERKRAEETIKLNEEKYSTLVEQAVDAIALYDADGKILDVNTGAVALLGYTKEELKKMSLQQILTKDEMAENPVRYDVLQKGESTVKQRMMRKKDGSKVQTEVRSQHLPDGRFLSVIRDLTERLKAQQQIEKEKELSDSIVSSLPGVFYLFNHTGKFLRWNKKFEEVTGYTTEEIRHMHPLNFFEGDDQQHMGNRIAEVFEKGISDAEADFITKNGEKIPYYFTGASIVNEGELCLLGTGIDITSRKKAETALKESEEKYRLLFRNSPLPMWVYATDSYAILDVNEAALYHYGYSGEEFMKLNFIDLKPKGQYDRFIRESRKYKPGIRNSGIWKHKKKDGTLIDVEINSHDIIYNNKPGWLAVAVDITDMLRNEKEIKRTSEQLRQLADHLNNVREEERTNIAREIHDELGQQLTVLKMDISWLSQKIGSDDNTVQQKMKDLKEMLDSTVKTVRKIASELRPSLLDDLGLVAAMEWHLKEFENRSGIKTKFLEMEAAEPSISLATKTGLYRIFQESLTNVARHAKAGKVIISLQQNDDIIALKIEDDGIGFDAKKTATQKTLGILGMKERTLIMGGSYTINSKPGKGTIVEVSVPVNQLAIKQVL